jgi:hypothetical protein
VIKEIEQAVNSIEQDIFNSTGGVEYLNMTVKSNGFVQIVEFIGIQLWNSEDDMREDINDNGDKEPIEVYLRRQLNKELSNLKLIAV